MPWFISKQYRHFSMVCDCWKEPEDSVSHGLCMQGGEECQPMCKQKENERWSALLVEIMSFMGAALESLVDKGLECPLPFVENNKHFSKHYFLCSLYAFKNLKSSSTWFNPGFPLRRAFLLLLCWVSLPTHFYIRSKHLCQLCGSFLICLLSALIILLCVDNYPWDIHVESNCWNLNLPMCCFNALIRIYCFMS